MQKENLHIVRSIQKARQNQAGYTSHERVTYIKWLINQTVYSVFYHCSFQIILRRLRVVLNMFEMVERAGNYHLCDVTIFVFRHYMTNQ